MKRICLLRILAAAAAFGMSKQTQAYMALDVDVGEGFLHNCEVCYLRTELY
jgi:hypothetical protein